MDLETKVFNFINDLGLDTNNYYKIKELPNSKLPKDLIEKLLKLNINAVYFFGETPTLLFKFSKKQNQELLYNTLLKSWNFDKAPILFYITDSNLAIYNTFIFPNKTNLEINLLGSENDVSNYHLSHLTSEVFWENKKSIFNNKNRINKRLLKNIIDAKKALSDKNLQETYIHSIIGRSLFLRYIFDRQLIPIESHKNLEDIFLKKNDLYASFKIIKEHFNGDLFPITDNEFKAVNADHLHILYTLFSGGEISTGQQSLFSYYDFSIIPIKLISNIYEKFLHDGENSSQAFYTPLATVDLVFEQLLGTSKINKESFRILDPSCGSGAFLVTFLKKYFEKNPKDISPDNVLNFVKNSLFGIDVDEDAIKITIFSLYITILEFFEQPAIQAHDFKFPDLLNKNFLVVDFFNNKEKLEKRLGKFDFIVGNPPWGTIKNSLEYYMPYCSKKNYPISDKQIAQAFMYRVKDFMNDDAIVSMVIPSKIFYNNTSNKFRKKFLMLFDIRAIIEMSLERHKTFNTAIHPSAIIFYSNHTVKNNIFTHLTLQPSIFYDIFQIFIFSEENIKSVSQKEILEKDWMWKSLLYGSQFDIDFMRRLKKNFSTTLEFLEKYNTNYGAGLIYTKSYSKSKKLSEEIFQNYKVVLTDKKTNVFYPHHIDLSNAKKLNEVYKTNTFHDKGSINSYAAPHLLIKRGVSSQGTIIGITKENCVFKNSVFGVHLNNIQILNFLAALYTSDLYNYYLFMVSSSWGVERPEVIMKEHRQLPVPKNITNDDIVVLSELYLKFKILYTKDEGLSGVFEKNNLKKLKCKKAINSYVNKLFGLKSLERKLIDFALTTYPQISENKIDKSKVSKNIVESFANNFLNETKVLFPKKSNKFHTYISIGDRFVFIYFCRNDLETKSIQNYTYLSNLKSIHSHIIESTFNLSTEQITTEVAFQRKIFGVDGNNFYLIKPNFKNIFHPLSAILDAKSFMHYWVHNV